MLDIPFWSSAGVLDSDYSPTVSHVPISFRQAIMFISTPLYPQVTLTHQPAQALEEEHPQISTYLHSLDPNSQSTINPANPTTSTEEGPISALAVETYTSHQTTNLLEETKRIMEASERDGTDPDEQLREVVERAVREGFNFGGALGGVAAAASGVEVDGEDEGRKRARDMDGNGNGV
jgi:hypothetical protein